MSRRRSNQTFQQNDLVRVAKYYPWIRQGNKILSHQIGHGELAVIVGSYYDQYGGGKADHEQYTLVFKKHGRVSWYDGDKLTLVEENRPDLYEKWSR